MGGLVGLVYGYYSGLVDVIVDDLDVGLNDVDPHARGGIHTCFL